jgi:hypothetical protein
LDIINLADICGTVGNIKPLQFQIVADDWKYINNLIEGQKLRYRTDLEIRVIKDAQQPENAAERIRRLLTTSIFRSGDALACKIGFNPENYSRDPDNEKEEMKNKIRQYNIGIYGQINITETDNGWIISDGSKKYNAKKEYNLANKEHDLLVYYSISSHDKELLAYRITNSMILEVLAKRLGPELTVFCSDFALLCKLDYALRFFARLTMKWIERELKNTSGETQNIGVAGLADIIVEFLARLVTNYRDLTFHKDGSRRRIGIELMGLTRANDISDRIIELLLSDHRIEGVNWAADEVTAWYFI